MNIVRQIVEKRKLTMRLSVWEGVVSSFSGAVIHQGFFIQGFLLLLNASNFAIAVVSNFQNTLAFVGILSGYYIYITGKRKEIVTISNLFYRGIWILPVISVVVYGLSEITLYVFIATVLISSIFFRLTLLPWMRWIDLITFSGVKAKYLGFRKGVVTFFILLSFIVAGTLLDYFGDIGRQEYAFMIIFFLVFALAIVASVLFYFHFDIPSNVSKRKNVSLWKFILKSLSLIKRQKFRNIIVFFILFEFVSSIALPFIPVHILKTFGLPYSYLSIQFSIYMISMFLFSFIWGIIIHKFGTRAALQLSILTLSLTMSLWAFIPKQLWFVLSFIEPFISGFASAGYELTMTYILFSEISERYKEMFFSIFMALVGMSIFFGSLIGGCITQVFSQVEINILYKTAKVYEIAFFITFIGRLVLGLFFIPKVEYKGNVSNAFELVSRIYKKLFSFLQLTK